MRRWIELAENATKLPDAVVTEAARELMKLIYKEASVGYVAFHMGCRRSPDSETDKECFRRKFPGWCREQITKAFAEIMTHFQGDKLPVWREITAPADWHPDPHEHPGYFWSYERDAAEAHWGDHAGDDVKWLLSAAVTFDQIDWIATLAQNGGPDYADEKEIRLNSSGKVSYTYARND